MRGEGRREGGTWGKVRVEHWGLGGVDVCASQSVLGPISLACLDEVDAGSQRLNPAQKVKKEGLGGSEARSIGPWSVERDGIWPTAE